MPSVRTSLLFIDIVNVGASCVNHLCTTSKWALQDLELPVRCVVSELYYEASNDSFIQKVKCPKALVSDTRQDNNSGL